MDPVSLAAFTDEMEKIAGFWQRFLDLFRSPETKAQKKVDYFFSPDTGGDRWRKLPQNAHDQRFVDRLADHPLADDQLKMHVQSLHDLSHGKPVAKMPSTTSPGKTYEVRSMPGGRLGCQCNDWRYKGSVNPDYECKHIRAYRQQSRS